MSIVIFLSATSLFGIILINSSSSSGSPALVNIGTTGAAVVKLSFDTLPRLLNPYYERVQGCGLVFISRNPILRDWEKKENLTKSRKSHDALFGALVRR